MVKSRNPVIVLGGGFSGLWIARNLGKYGVDVYLIVNRKADSATYSKYCKGSIVNTLHNQKNLKNLLKKMGRRLNKRIVVYPTSDLDTLILSKLKEELPDDFYLMVGDKESVETLVNKKKFYKALENTGISFPLTYFPEDIKDVQRIGKEVTYPIFVKPSISQLLKRIPTTDKETTKGFTAHSIDDLITYYKLMTKYGIEILFQEIISGPPSNSFQLEGYYDLEYNPTVLFARQRLRIWPTDFGNTTLCVSVALASLAKEKKMVNEFIKKIGYHGLMSCEFKKDSSNGLMKILEINARPWWHFWLSAKCGVDIIFASYLKAIGERTHQTEQYETGVKSIIILEDLAAALKMLLTGNLKFKDWIFSLGGKRVLAFFAKEDLSPFIMELATRSIKLFKKRRYLLTHFI